MEEKMSARAWLAFVALGVVWGLPYLLIKIALGRIAALEVAWWELTIGAAVLLPLAAARGELAQVRQHWGPIGALALLQLAVPSSLSPFPNNGSARRWPGYSPPRCLCSSRCWGRSLVCENALTCVE
jgi:hypothetical protein